ncbi:neurofilament medium polypeptide-like [Hibiscus syriacus]|uniref:Neurofilament medium polypeptide-like n=1 Tax=Hibiscus syriacus TaxID=106335 RepID=A0A6A2X693_HIBSY|nr:neurofilament medium polypeptide-like [Hibiscus syriacus]
MKCAQGQRYCKRMDGHGERYPTGCSLAITESMPFMAITMLSMPPFSRIMLASEDPQLVKAIRAATEFEVQATGIPYAFAPCIAVCIDPRWGRCYESYSEDHTIVQQLTTLIDGLQGEASADMSSMPYVNGKTKVAGCSKHYVGDGGTVNGINENNTIVDHSALYGIHMPAYVNSTAKGIATVMASYSSVNGVKMHANKQLLTDHLKGKLGFQGFVISDWEGIGRITSPPHSNYTYSIQASVTAGVDMVMVPYQYKEFSNGLVDLVKKNVIPMSRIDDAVTRILRVKFAIGLFENPMGDYRLVNEVGSQKHRKLAREAVRKSPVLLKNGKPGKPPLFPLPKVAGKILVTGTHADNLGYQCGGWTIECQGVSGNNWTVGTTILDAVKRTVDQKTKVVYKMNPSEDYSEKTNLDFDIVVVGEVPYAETRGDSSNLTIPNPSPQIIENACKNIKCVVVLISGRPVVIQPYLHKIDALVAAWLPGSEGQGVAGVLFGDFGFTGKLARTWFKSVDRLPGEFCSEVVGRHALRAIKEVAMHSERPRRGRHALRASYACMWELCMGHARRIVLVYATVPLEEDDDIGTMVGLHESTNIAVIELFVDVRNICDVHGSLRGVAQNPSEMAIYSQFEEPTYMFPNSFMALFESVNEVGGTSAVAEYETRNISELVVDIDAENRWGEIHDDSSEDEETEEHIDYDAMRAPEFPDMPHLPPYQMTESFDNSGEFSVGVQFKGKNEATLVIKEYCIKCHVDVHVAESNQKIIYAKCVKYVPKCKWKIRVSKNQRHDVWVITRYNGPHTCLRNSIEQDHRLLDSDVICKYVKAMVEKDPRISCSVLVASIRNQFGYQVKYGKRFIPGTIVKSQTMPAYDEEGQLLPGKKIFHRLFWAFKAYIEGFPFCKRMIQVDGTWLYGQYRHVLLMALAQDGERNIFPIAFVIVEGETTEAWDFFLTNLRQYVVREDGVCLISDRGTGILAAIERPGSLWIPLYAYLTFCICHIGKNSIDQFHNTQIRSEIFSMGYELRRPNFDKRLENLKVFYDDQRVWKWASKIPQEKWSQAYDEGRRYGHMTTNLAEAINSVLKGTRHFPIASVVKETYFRLAKVWSDKGKEIESLINRGKTWASTMVESMEANERLATSMVVHNFDRVDHTFVVSCIRRNVGGEDQTFRVDLRHKWCDFGRFQAWKYPCAHAVDACMYAGVSAYTYVDECFHLRMILNVYSYAFRQIPNKSYWPKKDYDEWLPNPMLRRSPKGRPESTRIHTSMNFHARQRGQAKRCGLCRGEGHSKNNCPNLPRYRPHH